MKAAARHAPAVLLLAALVGLRYAPMFAPGQVVVDADVLQDHFPTLVLMREAWDGGAALPFWNRHAFAGCPYYPVIDKPFLYPPVWALLAAFEPATAFTVSIGLHALLGALGAYALGWHLSRSRASAFVGAALFALATAIVRMHTGLPFWGYAIGWLPWAALAAHAAFAANTYAAARARATALGVLLALQVHAGGIFAASYTAMLVAAIALAGHAAHPRPFGMRLARLVMLGSLAAVVALGLTAVRLVPSLLWVELTTRGEAVGLRTALGETLQLASLEGKHFAWTALAWVGCGVLLLPLTRRRAAPYAIAAGVGLVLATGLLHAELYRWVPGYDRTRHVARALVLYVPAFAMLGTLGSAWVIVLARARLALRVPAGVHALALAAAAALLAVDHDLWPPDDFRRTTRLEPAELVQAPVEAVERRGRNSAGTRLYTTSRWDLARVYGRGLEATNGRLGGLRYREYEGAFDGLAGEALVKLLRVLGCHTAILRGERELPRTRRVDVMPLDLLEAQLRGEGRAIHAIARPLPRAARVARVVDVDTWAAPDLWKRLYALSFHEPDAVALRLVEDRRSWIAGQGPDVAGTVHPSNTVRHGSEHDDPFAPHVLWDPADPSALRALLEVDAREAPEEPDEPVGLPTRRSPNGLVVELDGRAGWVRLGETFALYPGWTAELDGRPVPLDRADGVATLVETPEGCSQLRLSYVPPGWRAGLGMTLATLAYLAGAALVRVGRRLRRRPSAGGA